MQVNEIKNLLSENETRYNQIINKIENSLFLGKKNPDNWSFSESFHHIYLTKVIIYKLIKVLSQGIVQCTKSPIKEFPVTEALLNKVKYENMPATPFRGTEPMLAEMEN